MAFYPITRFIDGVAYRQTMEQKSATDVFSQWAIIGKDEGMERGHAPSVKAMLELALPKVKEDFTAIDLGCGNGIVLHKILNQLNSSEIERGIKVNLIDIDHQCIDKTWH